MKSFFFPVMWIIPDFEGDIFSGNGFVIHKRKWEVSIFDLYSLAARKHLLKLPAELMSVFLQNVYLEIEVLAEDFQNAAEALENVRALLCIFGATPTVAPFATNYSLNLYAGINNRSASNNRDQMHPGLRDGITHDTAQIEAWPHELCFSCILGPQNKTSDRLTVKMLTEVSDVITLWNEIENRQSVVRAAKKALVKAPIIPDVPSSIIHSWQGIESLFPSVNAEVTFRISILLAMLMARTEDKVEIFNKSKRSYAVRSRIAHGSSKKVGIEEWMEAWSLLRDALKAIIQWKRLPSEQDLTEHLVGGSSF